VQAIAAYGYGYWPSVIVHLAVCPDITLEGMIGDPLPIVNRQLRMTKDE
jgi:hypothetical protein